MEYTRDFRVIITNRRVRLSVRRIPRCARTKTDGIRGPPPIKSGPRKSRRGGRGGGGRALGAAVLSGDGAGKLERSGQEVPGESRHAAPVPVRSSSRCRMRPGCVCPRDRPAGARATRSEKLARDPGKSGGNSTTLYAGDVRPVRGRIVRGARQISPSIRRAYGSSERVRAPVISDPFSRDFRRPFSFFPASGPPVVSNIFFRNPSRAYGARPPPPPPPPSGSSGAPNVRRET